MNGKSSMMKRIAVTTALVAGISGIAHAAGDNDSARVLSNTYAPADLPKCRAAIDWVLPEVLRVAPRNEAEIHRLQQGSR